MIRSRLWSRSALLVSAVIVAACTGTTPSPSTSTAPSASPASQPPTSSEPFEAMVYPEDGSNACEIDGYAGMMGSIKALDARTVEFTLCAPDAGFLSKVAFISLGIQDADYLTETGGGGEQLTRQPIGTGPYKLDTWTAEREIVLTANENYWGEAPKTATAIVQWSAESAQRVLELQSGTVDGIDNPGPADFAVIENDPALKLYPRTALNVFYVGMNNNFAPFDNEQVRQAIAMGIDRQRIVDNFYPPQSEVASHFTPCSIPGGCAGDSWYEFDPAKAKQMLEAANFDFSREYPISLRDVVRGYLPQPVVVAQELQTQLEQNLGIKTTIDVRDENTYLEEASRGELEGFHLLGWGADYPDVTNFLDAHFGVGASDQFGKKFDDVTGPITEVGRTADQAAREAAYTLANDAIKQHVPMIPIAHGGSATAFRADVEGGHSSPLSNEVFSVLAPQGRDQIVWLQNGEPGTLYCADETDGEALRVCEQIFEGLYSYEVGGTATQPALAESCTANDDSSVWTCTLREGVTFHNGATLDANDVVTTYAVQWDAKHPLHVGKEGGGLFEYWTYLWSAFLNPPAS